MTTLPDEHNKSDKPNDPPVGGGEDEHPREEPGKPASAVADEHL